LITINEVQGSDGWMKARQGCFTASELSAAAGLSKYMSRTDLLKQKATGITPDIDSNTQALFNKGHAAEDAARAIAEEIIGDDLSPVTGMIDVQGMKLLASFDGITFGGDTIWEHKLWSQSLAEAIRGGEIDQHYMLQIHQQMLVSGAKWCLFMTSDGTEKNMEYMTIDAPQSFDNIIAIWNQFAIDLVGYQHVAPVEKPQAAPIKDLPAIIITSAGSLSVETNFGQWEVALREFIAKIPEKPSTDQEFADCKAAVAAFKKAEAALDAEETRVLSMVPSVDEMKRHKKLLRDLSSTTRLALEKLVVRRDIEVKTEIMQAGKDALAAHIAGLNKRLATVQMPPVAADFAEAIKSKRNLENMRGAVADLVAAKKIESNEIADKIDANIKKLDAAKEHNFLFNDRAALVMKAADDLALVIKMRIAEHQQAEAAKAEAQRAAIQAEEERKATAKAQTEAAAILAAELAKQVAEEARARVDVEMEALKPAIKSGTRAWAGIDAQELRADRQITPPIRPDAKEIIETLQDVFGVSYGTACDWILEVAENLRVSA